MSDENQIEEAKTEQAQIADATGQVTENTGDGVSAQVAETTGNDADAVNTVTLAADSGPVLVASPSIYRNGDVLHVNFDDHQAQFTTESVGEALQKLSEFLLTKLAA